MLSRGIVHRHLVGAAAGIVVGTAWTTFLALSTDHHEPIWQEATQNALLASGMFVIVSPLLLLLLAVSTHGARRAPQLERSVPRRLLGVMALGLVASGIMYVSISIFVGLVVDTTHSLAHVLEILREDRGRGLGLTLWAGIPWALAPSLLGIGVAT